jgi:phage shock protein E
MNDDPTTGPLPDPGPIDGSQARRLVEFGAVLVDIRSPSEYRRGHIEGAINIPLHLLSAHYGELAERDQPVILYGWSGNRSRVAMEILQQRGMAQVFDLGAMEKWDGN